MYASVVYLIAKYYEMFPFSPSFFYQKNEFTSFLILSINHIFAYLMELEGISTEDLYTKTYFMP
jgi:hypothetical protein